MKTVKRVARIFLATAMAAVMALPFSACAANCKGGNTEDNGNGDNGDNSGNGQLPGTDLGPIYDENQGSNSSGVVKDVYTVTFDTGEGSAIALQKVEANGLVVKPASPERAGYMFDGWYTTSACDKAYNFAVGVNDDITIYAKWTKLDENIISVGGYDESLQVTWSEGSPAQAQVEYKISSATDWKTVDAPLIRTVESGVARVDILGLKAGAYNVKINTNGRQLNVPTVQVSEYDRSGYAHFGYNEGVGAYNNDGTLKEGALVIYVNESNKNNVKDYVYKNVNGSLVKEDISEFIKEGVPASNGKPLGGDTYASIGYILNNRGYENEAERNAYGIHALTFKYGAVAVRILGNVTSELNADRCSPTLTGLTYYAQGYSSSNNAVGPNINPITGEQYSKGVSVPNGGTVNDNGQMARITNAKNLTIEGVGADAGMEGWGVHFVSNDNQNAFKGEAGKGFEVRNLTFKNYPEDAIGMEGTQGTKVEGNSITGGASSADARLISPVERCWIHNNVFLPGYCANPAESDKGEGDGSCDFKRGQYYTLSYNYFEYCHKTNLLGSSDTSLQYNITMHHNWWNNCGSRQPLLRRANVHFYNNYISGDSNDQAASLSYVTSARANSYMFSEANYFDGSKQVVVLASGGAVKAYNNTYYACFGGDSSVKVSSREQTVSNSCKFIAQNIDFSKFDTDDKLFYYDKENKKSDCLLDDAQKARIRVMSQAGVIGFGKTDTAISRYTPENAVKVNASGETEIALPTAKNDTVVNGVMFNNLTGAGSGSVKGKGQIITFTLSEEAELIASVSAKDGDSSPELVGFDGTVYASKFTGTLKTVLPAGSYFIASGQKDKEATVTKLAFVNTAASSAERVKEAENAINALPAPDGVTLEHAELIKAAQNAYNALTAAERQSFNGELAKKYNDVIASYNGKLVGRVFDLINDIGTVDKNSYEKINRAQQAYDGLSASLKSKVTNYQTLVEAWITYDGFAVQSVNEQIAALPDVDELNVGDRTAVEGARASYESVKAAYERLSDGGEDGENNQQAQVIGYDKVISGLVKLEGLQKLFEFKDLLSAVNLNSVTAADSGIKTLYDQLTQTQKNALSAEEKAKYAEFENKLTEILSKSIAATFDREKGAASDSFFEVTGSNAKNSPFTVNAYGTINSGLKMESATRIKFTISAKMVLKLYIDAAGSVCVGVTGDGKIDKAYASAIENGDNVVTVTLEAGTYIISKKDSRNLYYATLTPAV